MEQVLDGLRAIAEETRLRLLVICYDREFTVSELTRILGQSQPRVSRHLKLLCDAGVLERFREQNFVLYRVSHREVGGELADAILKLLPLDDEVFHLDQLRIRDVIQQREREAKETLAQLPSNFLGFREDEKKQKAVDHALLDLTKDLRIGDLLDIGTGTGRMLRILGNQTDHAVGIDISPQMLRLARAQLSQAGLGKFSIRYGDMYHLDFPNESFDTVTMDQVLSETSEPAKVLQEAVRLIRPGGNLLIVNYREGGALGSTINLSKVIRDQFKSISLDLSRTREIACGNGQVSIYCGKKPAQKAGCA